jgi:hypothetical protein
MALDPSIILSGRGVDVAGAMSAGNALATQTNALRQQNALTDLYKTQGAGLVAGDQGAVNALAAIDPNAALGIKDATRGMAWAEEDRMAAKSEGKRMAEEAMKANAASLTAEQIAAEKKAITDGLSGAAFFYQKGDEAGYNNFLAQQGMDPSQFDFADFPAHAAMFEGAIEAMESFAPPAPDLTSSQKDYQFYAQQEAGAGRTPLSFNDWDTQGKRAAASTTNISTGSDIGTIPQGWELVTDPATGARSMRPIVGGPEDKSKAASNAAGADMIATDTITTAAARARDAAKSRQLGGFGAGLAAQNPYTDSAEVERQIDVLRANAATTTLQAMRDASPTGSTGLGALTAPEMKVIQDKAGALNQNSPNFLRDLEDYERTLLRVIHGPEAGDRIFEATRAGATGGAGSSLPGQDEIDLLMQGP